MDPRLTWAGVHPDRTPTAAPPENTTLIIRGTRIPLARPVHTPWGIYQPGHIATVISGVRGQITVCLDMDGHDATGFCHNTTVDPDALFTWPDTVTHGTPRGYRQHLTHMQAPCKACRDAYNQKTHADRVRGTQPTLAVPKTFLARLLDTAPLDLLEEADQLWGTTVVDAIRDN